MKGLQRYLEYEYIYSAIEPYRAAENTAVNIAFASRQAAISQKT